MQLLVETKELRAADRILEEVLLHSSTPGYHEDLLASLDLIGRSPDPGRAGKILRILRGPDAPVDARRLLKEWVEDSPHAGFLPPEGERGTDFVHRTQDFSAFAARLPDLAPERICERWSRAYHESLGWQQPSELPRSDFEILAEARIQAALADRLASGDRSDEAALRARVESAREEFLESPGTASAPIVRIYRERPQDDPWRRDVYSREVNALYIQAAERYDDGDLAGARKKLDLLLEIEPDYPLARVLDRILNKR
jgi:hypothetical protein